MMKVKEAKQYTTQILQVYCYYEIEYEAKETYGRIVEVLEQVLAILERRVLMGVPETFATEALKLTREVDSLCNPSSNERREKPFFPLASSSAVCDFTISFKPLEKRFEKLIANIHEQWDIWVLLDVLSVKVEFDFREKRDRCVGILSQLLAIMRRREEVGIPESFAIEALALIRKADHPWDRRDCISLSAAHDFFVGFEPIENQIKDLIHRETGIGPPMGHDGPLVGLEEDVQLLTAHLVTDNAACRVVSIVGRRGIGKTTLAQKIYDSAVVQKHFDCHAWVTIPQDRDIRSVQLSIVVQVMPFQKLDKPVPVEELLTEFLMDNRYLIVLDDVQTPQDWTILEQSLPAGSSGSRIMIITRNREIVDDGPYCFVLEKRALSDEEGWELFSARVGSFIPKEFEEIGRGIVMRCTGLPLFICEVGDKLSKRRATQEQWYMALEEINHDQLLFIENVVDGLTSNLKKCL